MTRENTNCEFFAFCDTWNWLFLQFFVTCYFHFLMRVRREQDFTFQLYIQCVSDLKFYIRKRPYHWELILTLLLSLFFIDLLTGNERAELYRLNYLELIPKANYENQTKMKDSSKNSWRNRELHKYFKDTFWFLQLAHFLFNQGS